MLRRILALPMLITMSLFTLPVQAVSMVEGYWQTIDDHSGKAKSIVRIYEEDGQFMGQIVDLLLKPDDSVCKECKGDLLNQPIVGMTILQGLEKKGDEYSGGEILDPENGKTYRCKVWLDGDNLKVRGYIGFLFRTQTWYKVPTPKNLPLLAP